MEARRIRPTSLGLATAIALLISSQAPAQFGKRQEHVAHSQNFIVFASTPELASQVSQAAESHRRELSIRWLGKEIPAWAQRCPIHVQTSPKLGAGGETRFSLMPGGVGNWMMSVQGTEQRVLDSVLPHEITHTIFATHFAPYNKYVPRWADEGACTTVEHIEEKSKHEHFLQEFLRTGRGISFNKMFSLKDYPNDILPLYAQGHSVVQFLLDQGGPRKFVTFLEDGMRSDNWQVAMKKHYRYETIGELQQLWNKWLRDGSPDSLVAYAPSMQNESAEASIALASSTAASSTASTATPPTADVQLAALQRNVTAGAMGGETPDALRDQDSLRGPDPLRGLENASFASGPSWYRNQLRAVSSGAAPAQAVDPALVRGPADVGTDLRAIHPYAAAADPAYPQQAYQASRQTAVPPQRNSIQVLDWGDSEPVSGVATVPQMVPLMR